MATVHDTRLEKMKQGAVLKPTQATTAELERELRLADREIRTLLRGRRALKRRLAAA